MKYSTNKAELFEQIYEKYVHDIYKISLYFVRDEHVAQDLTQRAFLSLYEHFENVKPDKYLQYLARAVHNMAYNWLKAFKRLQDGQIEDLNDACLLDESVEDVCMRRYEKWAAIELADSIMTDLFYYNQNWFQAIAWTYYMEVPQVELAARLHIEPEVLYNRMTRARKWIREHYAEAYEEYLKKKHG